MKKLKVIFQLLFADEWAVFTYRYAPENPYITYGDLVTWNIRRYSDHFLKFIQEKVSHIMACADAGYDVERNLQSKI